MRSVVMRSNQCLWKVLKNRLLKEGNELVTNCHQLKLVSPKDGKKYSTDVATVEQALRLIQSIPSPKAEPLKVWLAQLGRERIEETIDPELTIDRALETYLRKGYSGAQGAYRRMAGQRGKKGRRVCDID